MIDPLRPVWLITAGASTPMRRWLATVSLLFLPQQLDAQMMDHGTLVVMIPTFEGIVAASDSRLTLDDGFCDGVEKFIELKAPHRTLLFVTGRRGFWPLLFYALPDKCAAAKTTPREFDLGLVAKAFVEAANVSIDKLDMNALQNHCLTAMHSYLQTRPHWINGTMTSSAIVLATFDPKTRISRIRSSEFHFSFSPGGTLSAREQVNAIFSPQDIAEPYTFGESVFYLQHVHPILVRNPKRDATRRYYATAKVADLGIEMAAEIAVEMLETASFIAKSVPTANGIGGPIDIRVATHDAIPVKWYKQ